MCDKVFFFVQRGTPAGGSGGLEGWAVILEGAADTAAHEHLEQCDMIKHSFCSLQAAWRVGCVWTLKARG